MEYPYSKEDFLKITKEIRNLIASNEHAECSCPNARCELHGDCCNCIRAYRHFAHHVPRCLQFVLDNKRAAIINAIETEMAAKPSPPGDYYDYRDSVMPVERPPVRTSSESK